MKTALTVFFTGLVFAAAVTLVAARSPKHEVATASPAAQSAFAQVVDDRGPVQVLVFAPLYGSSPRIIHVPQRTDRTEARTNTNEAAANGDDIDDYQPTAPEPLVKHIKRTAAKPGARATVGEPKETEALSPVYPTPHYGAGASANEAAISKPSEVMPPPPPIGYSPPSSLPATEK